MYAYEAPMRAIVIVEPGGPEVLSLQERPDPPVPLGHVRVAVSYTAVNRADIIQRLGAYPAPPGVPADIPGLEYAGSVVEVGPGVIGRKVGDRVYGLVGGGAYASQVVVHERETAPVPDNVTDEQAAAIPEAYVTAYDALVTRGGLQPGQTVLVHACGSGVGTAGVQVASALGCTVLGTSRTADKLERCRALGLHTGIVPDGGQFADQVRAATGGRGADVVMDLVGGAYVPESLDACAKGGRVVVVGLTAGAVAELDLRMLLMKRLTLVGTVLRARPLEEKIAAAQLLERTLSTWLTHKRIAPVIEAAFPLEDAGKAHTLVAGNQTFGKVLLRVAL